MVMIKSSTPQRVACVGVGNIGRAWAIAFARGGSQVRLYDMNVDILKQSLELIGHSLDDLVNAGLLDNADTVLKRIETSASLADVLEGASYVQESVREDLELKCQLFRELDALAPPSVILASSSSEFVSSEFIRDVSHTERCIVAHPFNPPYLIPVVEISGHERVPEEIIKQTRTMFDAMGMSPVVLNKEIKAFLLNRIQAAVVTEALYLVGEGYCSAEDLDLAFVDGLAARWSFMGPFRTGHLNARGGYSEYMRAFGGIYKRTAANLEPAYNWTLDLIDSIAENMEQTIPTRRVVDGQRWRDRRLMALKVYHDGADDFV